MTQEWKPTNPCKGCTSYKEYRKKYDSCPISEECEYRADYCSAKAAQTKLLKYLIEHINHRDAAKDWQSGKGGIESLIPKLESMRKQLEEQK